MHQDGRFDTLAKGLPDAFVQGSEWVARFIKRLADVDFGTPIDKTSAWLSSSAPSWTTWPRGCNCSSRHSDVVQRCHSGISAIALASTGTPSGRMVAGIEKVAEKMAAGTQGGERIRSSVAIVHDPLSSMSEGFRQQIQQDAQIPRTPGTPAPRPSPPPHSSRSQAITDTFTDLGGCEERGRRVGQAQTSPRMPWTRSARPRPPSNWTALQGEMLWPTRPAR
ncbi:hypothetical protein P4050_00475 [Pseudomonas aeruginosa]|nr:hypothetical protein [Pseudomonas aeruginosa]